MKRILVALFVLAFFPTVAKADGLIWQPLPNVKCSPVLALTGYQYNVVTKIFQKGVSFGGGYGCRYTGWALPLSLNAVGGVGLNSNAPNAGQGNLIFAVNDNYGLGVGSQVFKDSVDGTYHGQTLISFFLGASVASTIDQLDAAKDNAAKAALRGTR